MSGELMPWLRLTLFAGAMACAAVAQAADKLVILGPAPPAGAVRVAYRTEAGPAGPGSAEGRILFAAHETGDPTPGALAVSTDSCRAEGSIRLTASGLGTLPSGGDPGASIGPVAAAACALGAEEESCRCSSFAACARRPIAQARGTKLVCRDGEPDPTCAARKSRCPGGADCLLADWNGDGFVVVACAGDSNTYQTHKMRRWCRYLDDWLPGAQTRPIGWPGTRASDDPARAFGYPLGSHVYLKNMLGLPLLPDVVILAWGTNDVPLRTPEQIADAIDVLVRWMRKAGVVPLVATVPWRLERTTAYNARIDTLNAILAARYGACLVDLTTITPPTSEWYVSGRHLNAAAQERRAIVAYRALETMPRSCAAGVAPSVARDATPG